MAEQFVEIRCPQGERVIGGGAFAPELGASGFVALTASQPLQTLIGNEFDGWRAGATEVNGGSAQNWRVSGYAICAQL
jgi:hypothetical protein